jgi:hypothetical protein
MASTPISRLLSLPYEVRRIIYDQLIECQDLTPLMQTCCQLRDDVWSCLPGGQRFNYSQPSKGDERLHHICDIGTVIEVSKIELIAEPWYSSGSALKVRATWRYRDTACSYTTSTWTIRDLSSPMAQVLCLYDTQRVTVIFEPATRGNMQAALLILRSKVFDICRLMLYMICKRDRETFKVNIVFRGGKDGSRLKSTRKSFWEMRPMRVAETVHFIYDDSLFQLVPRRNPQSRGEYPFFYECLMLPLFSCRYWVPDNVCFQLEPDRKHSSFVYQDDNGQMVYSRGWQSLVEAEHIMVGVEKKLGVEGVMFYPGNPIYGRFQLKTVQKRMVAFSRDTGRFLSETASPEEEQLRAYLRRMKASNSASPFIGNWYSSNLVLKMRTSYAGRYEMSFKNRFWGLYKGAYHSCGEDFGIRKHLLRWALLDPNVSVKCMSEQVGSRELNR